MKKLKFWIFKKFCKKEVIIPDNLVRKVLYQFMCSTGASKYLTTITNVEHSLINDTLEIIITSHRPGILIGKGGRYISSMVSYFAEEFGKKVKIDIKESKLWKKLYN